MNDRAEGHTGLRPGPSYPGRRIAGWARPLALEDRPPRERRPQDKLARLIAGATIVFSEEGYAQARVQAVCHAAGVSVGTFYDHFDNKADLMLRVAEQAYETALAPDPSSLRQFEHEVSAFVASPRAGIVRAWLWAIGIEPELRLAHARMRRTHLAHYTEWVREARARRGRRAPLDDGATARAVIALLDEAVVATYEAASERVPALARAIWFLLYAE